MAYTCTCMRVHVGQRTFRFRKFSPKTDSSRTGEVSQLIDDGTTVACVSEDKHQFHSRLRLDNTLLQSEVLKGDGNCQGRFKAICL